MTSFLPVKNGQLSTARYRKVERHFTIQRVQGIPHYFGLVKLARCGFSADLHLFPGSKLPSLRTTHNFLKFFKVKSISLGLVLQQIRQVGPQEPGCQVSV